MPKATYPQRIILSWGLDRLVITDQGWIEKIIHQMPEKIAPYDERSSHLGQPRSLRAERLDAELVASGFRSSNGDSDESYAQVGYEIPDHQNPAAIEALSKFLDLDMPLALNFTSRGRSTHRMSAVDAYFRPCWRYGGSDEIMLQWMFHGYQLYASHHVGGLHSRPHPTGDLQGDIERRLLNGQWVRWGFDGASTPPPGRQWSRVLRFFQLTPSGIERIGNADSDLMPEFDYCEFEGNVQDGMVGKS